MDIELSGIGLSMCIGFFTGCAYLAALWVSVQGLARSTHPLMRLFGGAALRLALVLGTFGLVMGDGWPALSAALFGFVVARVVVVHWLAAATRARVGLRG